MSHDNQESTQDQQNTPVTTGSTGEGAAPDARTASSHPQNGKAKSVSPRKLAANRANAHRSTGPQTAEGKAKSSQNSCKHGFFARKPLPAGEEGDQLWEEYRDLVDGIWEYYQPEGYMEGLLTEKIATESIRFSRLLDYESKYLGQKQAFYFQGVDRVLRFQSAINRQLFQTIHELERLQANRKAQRNRPEDQRNDGVEQTAPAPTEPEAPQRQGSGVPREPANEQMPANPRNEGVATPDVAGLGLSGRNGATPSAQATTDRQQLSLDRPHASDYGTNPTGAQSEEPDGDAGSTPFPLPKTSLVDLVSQSPGLPAVEGADCGRNPSATVVSAE